MQRAQRRINPCDRNDIQLSHMPKHLPYGSELPREIWYSIHTRSCSLPIWFWPSRTFENTCIKSLAVLDSGATNTVAGEVWNNCYIINLNENEKQNIKHHTTGNTYWLGDGKLFPALQNVDIPISMGSRNVMLNTDVVASDIPLLLSRKSMKKANMTLDFKNDHAVIFDQSIQLIVTKSGQYPFPINPYIAILNNVTSGVNTNVTLVAIENKSKNDIAIKLHLQFAHPSPEKLLKMLNSTEDPC